MQRPKTAAEFLAEFARCAADVAEEYAAFMARLRQHVGHGTHCTLEHLLVYDSAVEAVEVNFLALLRSFGR